MKSGKGMVWITEVYLTGIVHVESTVSLRGIPKPISYIVFYAVVSRFIPCPFWPCHVPNPHMSLGVSRAEKYFTQDTWGLITEREAGGFCTGRG